MNGLALAKETHLKICECKIDSEAVTCEISLSAVENLIRQKFKIARATFVAWQVQNIFFGKYDGEKLSARAEIQPENWLECRIFNETEELHLKRLEKNFCGRYISEVEGTENFYADSFSRLWGENSGSADGYVELLDRQRKLYLEIPCEENKFKWYGLLTRNYIESDERTGLSGFSDYRFVAIEPAEEVKQNA